MSVVWKRWLIQGWQAFWFTPEPALNLAVARLIIAAHALWMLLSRDLPALSAVPDVFWAHISPTLHWRYLLWAGHPHLEYGLQTLAIGALCAAILGIVPRLACFVAGVLLYHLAPLETIIWEPGPWGRGLTIAVLGLLTLSCSPCGDALSVVHYARPGLAPAAAYNWPLRLIQLFFCQIYFFAGYSKFARFGFAWLSAENVRNWLLLFNEPADLYVFTSLGSWLARQPVLCWAIAFGTPLLELSSMIVVFWKRARLWWGWLMLIFHVGIFFSMSIAFLNVPQLLIFVDWQAVSARWSTWRHIYRHQDTQATESAP